VADDPGARALGDDELLALALLCHRYREGRQEPLPGAALAALLARAGFPRTSALALLGPGAPLRRGGWLLGDTAPGAHDPLEARLRPSREALELFWPAEQPASGTRPAVGEETAPKPYPDEEAHLWDLLAWRNLCMQRAEALFDADMALGRGDTARLRELRRRCHAALVHVRARLGATPGGASYGVERFRRRHRLGSDDLLVVVHLLFCEILEGEPFLSALECVRLLADSRADLFLKRGVLGQSGRLRRQGIVLGSDDAGESPKALAIEVCLADWAAEELTAGLRRPLRLDGLDLDDLFPGDADA